ncbi:MAG: ATP-binding protein [Thermodesulfobacteriota bacterium]
MPILTIDSEKILLILKNIIGNAIKFTVQRGRVRILVRSICQGAEVSVAGTGPGIPAGNLITIFEKFEQTTMEALPPVHGTGLGKAVAKQKITHDGGKIWARSK